jgi:DNA-binding NarL/FixJ family response regulator
MAANVFLIIDDHPIFSRALVALLGDAFPGSRFLTAGTLDEGRQLLLSSSNPAPIVLLDINLPDSKGAHGARELIRIMPGLKIIALSAEDARDRQAQLLKSGVHGFLSKTVQPEIFIAKLNELIRAPMRTQRSDNHQIYSGEFELSERQRAVIIELSRGRSNKEIAQSLGIGAETVKTHVSEIIRRLNVRNRAEAIRHFMMRGANIESDE